MKFNEKILHCRKKAGLSQEALAEKLGVSRQAVSKWENGESTPDLEKLALLSEVFNVTADWLLSPEPPVEEQRKTEGTQRNWVDSLPGTLGRLVRRYGWLAGVRIAATGLGAIFIGTLARVMVKKMFSGWGEPPLGDMVCLIDGTVTGDFNGFPGIMQPVNMAANNPVYLMGTFMLVAGIVLTAAGTVLAIYLKKRFDKEGDNP